MNRSLTEQLAIGLPRLLLLGLAAAVLVLLTIRLDLLRQYRTDIAGAEFNVVYGVQKLMLGQPLYQDPELPPFDIMQYTPLYYWTCAGMGKLIGVDPQEPHSVFLLSRWLSLLFNLATVLLVFFTLARMVRWPYAAWAALLSFTAFSQHFFSRSDSLYALLFMGAVHCIVRWSDEGALRRDLWLSLSATLAVLAFMAKQTAVLVLMLIPLHLMLLRDWRSLLRFSVVAAMIAALSLGAITLTTPLSIFYKNTVQGLMNGTSIRFLRMMVEPHLYRHYIGWHIASLVLVLPLFRLGDSRSRFFAIALPLSLAFSFTTALKSGSDFNYFFENLVLAFMAIALHLGGDTQHADPNSRRSGIMRWLGIAVMAYGLYFAVHRTRMFRDWAMHHSNPEVLMLSYQADMKVRDILRDELGLRAEEGVFITYRGHLEHLFVGQGMLTQKDIIEWSVTPPFDYSAFDRAMRDGSIRFVISHEPAGTITVMGREYSGYREVMRIDGRHILTREPE